MRIFGIAFLMATVGLMGLAQEKQSDRRDRPSKDEVNVEKQIQQILKDDGPSTTGYRLLFDSVGPVGIRKLQSHLHDSIAIQSAWEEVRLTVPENKASREKRPDPQRLNWFLGFLEGRARVQVPEWWRESVLDARAHDRSNIYFPGPKKEIYHRPSDLGWFKTPLDTTLSRQGESTFLRIGPDSIQLPQKLVGSGVDGTLGDSVTALFNPLRCYVAFHYDDGNSFDLTCIERQSLKTLWKAKVRALYILAIGLGHETFVTIIERHDKVFVFGLKKNKRVFVEAFRADDGKNLIRFSSSD